MVCRTSANLQRSNTASPPGHCTLQRTFLAMTSSEGTLSFAVDAGGCAAIVFANMTPLVYHLGQEGSVVTRCLGSLKCQSVWLRCSDATRGENRRAKSSRTQPAEAREAESREQRIPGSHNPSFFYNHDGQNWSHGLVNIHSEYSFVGSNFLNRCSCRRRRRHCSEDETLAGTSQTYECRKLYFYSWVDLFYIYACRSLMLAVADKGRLGHNDVTHSL